MTVSAPYGRVGASGVRRLVNDNIAELAARFADANTASFEFLCECGDLRCREAVTMTIAEFRARELGSVLAHA